MMRASSIAECFRVVVERALVLVSVEKPENNKRDSSHERNSDETVDESELDRLLNYGTPFVIALAEHLDSEKLTHLPDKFVVASFRNKRKHNSRDRNQNENGLADRDKNFH